MASLSEKGLWNEWVSTGTQGVSARSMGDMRDEELALKNNRAELDMVQRICSFIWKSREIFCYEDVNCTN